MFNTKYVKLKGTQNNPVSSLKMDTQVIKQRHFWEVTYQGHSSRKEMNLETGIQRRTRGPSALNVTLY